MDFKVNIISEEVFKSKYKKPTYKITKSRGTYVKLTQEEKDRNRADRMYRSNWRNSTTLPKAKSQRIADLNNKYL